ncbi:MAG: UDP-3-O-acyl-N-acetylglucosamine deacetylase [bacterium]
MKRATVNNEWHINGIGLHTGQQVNVIGKPASSGCGIIFAVNGIEIPALAEYVDDTTRCTRIANNGASLRTIEHLMAAIYLCGITDMYIEVDGPELPALEGAAKIWYDILKQAGIRCLEGEILTIALDKDDMATGNSHINVAASDKLELFAEITIPGTKITGMTAGGDITDADVIENIISARTYGLEREVRHLLDSGLAKGGSLDNAVIITETGYLNNDVRHNEPAWHKVLDLLGDLALTGFRLQGRITAVRSGHYSHVEMAKNLRVKYAVK